MPCRTTGNPKPKIGWMHNDVVLVMNRRIQILEDGSLKILHTVTGDEGMYQCTAVNSLGSATAIAYITYLKGTENRQPVLTTIPPTSAVVTVDNSIVLPCSAVGQPKPKIVWFKNGKKLSISNDHYSLVKRSSDLKITDAIVDDEGLYVCRASNKNGWVSTSTLLSVHAAPEFIEAPQHRSLALGHSAQFQCRVVGRPTPVISWDHDGMNLPVNSRQRLLSSGDLLITDLEKSDEGSYTCHAENRVSKTSHSAILYIRIPSCPTFSQRPANTIAVRGSSVKLACHASEGTGIRWMHNGNTVREDGRIFINNVGTLTIRSVAKSDEGTFACLVFNRDCEVTSSASLTVTEFASNQQVQMSIAEAERKINEAITGNIAKLINSNNPADLRKILRFPNEEALAIAKATEFLEAFIQLIQDKVVFNLTESEMSVVNLVSPHQLQVLANMSGCMLYQEHDMCANTCYHKKYRTYDGTCNNLQNRLWGAAVTPLKRALEPVYENHLNSPVGWSQSQQVTNGKAFGPPHPSPRVVSTEIISAHDITPDPQYTHMLMQFGQFLDHDITHSPTSPSAQCDDHCNATLFCYPIPISPEDRRIRDPSKCMSFTRSAAMCGTGATSVFFESVSSREQINQITAYIDGSMVYGSSSSQSLKLRNATGKGLLKQGRESVPGKHLLPHNDDEFVDCLKPRESVKEVPCFLAGDRRVNEQVALTALHTIWMREHNRIATVLSELNPHWDDDKLFQEARKIVGAQLQHITYKEFLPKVLGDEAMMLLSDYKAYNSEVDASILNSFATAAYRFGHGLIHPVIRRLNASFQSISEGDLNLRDAFFAPVRIVEEGGIDPLLRGMFASSGKLNIPSEVISSELTEHLFAMAHEVAFDLGALNLQRGRDHGLPPYTKWREFCGLSVPNGFSELESVISNKNIRDKLKKLYDKPENIDLWVGGLVEDALPQARVGPTFACIIAEQFKRIRNGDRFWYENPSVFEPSQLAEIKKTTLARIICENSDGIEHIQNDVFLVVSSPDEYRSCSSLPQMDLHHWSDCSGKMASCVSESDCFSNEKPEQTHRVVNRRSVPVMHQDDSNDETKLLNNNRENVEKTIDVMVEAIVVLQGTVDNLQKELNDQENCHVEGQLYENNQSWKPDDCIQCQCQNGQVTCDQDCKPVDCDKPVKIPGLCCPVCQ
jgi:peroxidase